MRFALADLKLTSLEVIHAGEHSFDLSESIRSFSWYELPGV